MFGKIGDVELVRVPSVFRLRVRNVPLDSVEGIAIPKRNYRLWSVAWDGRSKRFYALIYGRDGRGYQLVLDGVKCVVVLGVNGNLTVRDSCTMFLKARRDAGKTVWLGVRNVAFIILDWGEVIVRTADDNIRRKWEEATPIRGG